MDAEVIALRTLEALAAVFAAIAVGLAWTWARSSRGFRPPDVTKPRVRTRLQIDGGE